MPIAEKVDKQKKFLWITTAIADAVLKDRNLQYTFRPQANGGLFGAASVQYIADYAQDKLKKAAQGPAGRHHLRGRALRRRRGRRQRGGGQEARACRSC